MSLKGFQNLKFSLIYLILLRGKDTISLINYVETSSKFNNGIKYSLWINRRTFCSFWRSYFGFLICFLGNFL